MIIFSTLLFVKMTRPLLFIRPCAKSLSAPHGHWFFIRLQPESKTLICTWKMMHCFLRFKHQHRYKLSFLLFFCNCCKYNYFSFTDLFTDHRQWLMMSNDASVIPYDRTAFSYWNFANNQIFTVCVLSTPANNGLFPQITSIK